ncbi:oligosaccharide flippase family protein [Calothrix sp. PCC 7507]|uniref:oligosaccharide flippase family protein n=1 Tax=Calothrix sp. PCC 7507 TaxID=99598 RepID=UPI0019171930|nr:oligosaccharide flippase family protein [Calothrix sp. PCC 7507]
MSGGLYLALRQSIGMVISLGGVLLLTRLIGPEKYGLYAATFGIFWYLQTVCQLGIEIYLVRHEGEEKLQIYHQGFTLLLLLGIGGMGISLLSIPLIQSWVRLPGFSAIAQVMFLGLPLVLLGQVPAARLERNLDYRKVALIELANQIIFYLIALPLAFQGWGVWAPVMGWWFQQVQSTGLLYWASRYSPRLYWNPSLVKQMLAYSLGFSTSIWIWYARSLVNPLLVGRFAGAEAVGFVAIAIRLVEVLGFVKAATWRLAIATLAKFQGDQYRLLNAVTEGMGLQILALGPLLVAFAWVAPYLMPLLFGDQWSPVIAIFPFIALGNLTNALFNMHSSTLYVLQRNWEVTIFHLVHVTLFVGATALLVPHLGLVGYGWAEIVALLSYGVIHLYLVRSVGNPVYDMPGLWWAALAAALFVHPLGWWTSLGLVAVICLPATHCKLREYVKSIRG